MSPEELLDIMNYINRIIKHIADGNEYEERMVSIMGGTVEETPSQKLKRLEDEKNILSLFSNGADFQMNDYWNCKNQLHKNKISQDIRIICG